MPPGRGRRRPALLDPRSTAWLDRVEPELANVRAALDFARGTGDVVGEAQLASSMRHYWRVRGHGIEGKRRLEEALEHASDIEPRLLARLQREAAVMRLVTGDFEGARTLFLSALEAYAELGDTIEVGRAYAELGALANAVGDPRAGIEHSETAVEMLSGEEFIQLDLPGQPRRGLRAVRRPRSGAGDCTAACSRRSGAAATETVSRT